MPKRKYVENIEAFSYFNAEHVADHRNKNNDHKLNRKNVKNVNAPIADNQSKPPVVVFGKSRITQRLGVFGDKKTSRLVSNINDARFQTDFRKIVHSKSRPPSDEPSTSHLLFERDQPDEPLNVEYNGESSERNRGRFATKSSHVRNISPDVLAAGSRWTTETSSPESNISPVNPSANESPVDERVRARLDEIFPNLRCRDTNELYVERTARRIFQQMIIANPDLARKDFETPAKPLEQQTTEKVAAGPSSAVSSNRSARSSTKESRPENFGTPPWFRHADNNDSDNDNRFCLEKDANFFDQFDFNDTRVSEQPPWLKDPSPEVSSRSPDVGYAWLKNLSPAVTPGVDVRFAEDVNFDNSTVAKARHSPKHSSQHLSDEFRYPRRKMF